MKVLVACEYSGIVRDAFLRHGHDAISCDLLPTKSSGPHIQGDVTPLLKEPWDLVIAHPPCQRLTSLNDAHPNNRCRDGFWEEFAQAVSFFQECLNANAPKVAVENPTMWKLAKQAIGPYSQLVQPYYFGEGYSKRTAWWLKGLPPLMATLVNPTHPSLLTNAYRNNKGLMPNYGAKQKQRRQSERAAFHPGMADAMAVQWGSL